MEMGDAIRRLVDGRQGGGMDEWDAEVGDGAWEAPQRGRQAPMAGQLRAWSRWTICFVALLLLLLLLLVAAAVAMMTTITVLIIHGGCQDYNRPSAQNMEGARQPLLKDWKTPSALLTAHNGKNTSGPYLAWESVLGDAYCDGGFTYSEDSRSLVVPRDGRYRVFLQITYESSGHHSEADVRLAHSVVVVMKEYPVERPLLSVEDMVSSSLKHWKRSLHTDSLFNLTAGSMLRVKVLHGAYNVIYNTQESVFFGAHLLP